MKPAEFLSLDYENQKIEYERFNAQYKKAWYNVKLWEERVCEAIDRKKPFILLIIFDVNSNEYKGLIEFITAKIEENLKQTNELKASL